MTIRTWARSSALSAAVALWLFGCGGSSGDPDRGAGPFDGSSPDAPAGIRPDTMPDAVSCGNGKSIHYTSPGCGAAATPRCDSPTFDACAAVVWYCSCDGVTGVVGGCGTSNVPFLSAGPCKTDAGPSTFDATLD